MRLAATCAKLEGLWERLWCVPRLAVVCVEGLELLEVAGEGVGQGRVSVKCQGGRMGLARLMESNRFCSLLHWAS